MTFVRRRVALWAPVLTYMALIFVASSLSRPPQPPGGVSYTTVHVGVYAGLGAILVRALAGGLRARVTGTAALASTIIATVYGITDEIHQHFVPQRQAELLDLAADGLGAALAAGVLYLRSRLTEA
jgi:VanZ family protein